LINHSKSGANIKPAILENDGKSLLYFYAKNAIPSGKELFYDYGERDSDILRDPDFAWLLK